VSAAAVASVALAAAGISYAELTKDGPKGDGDIHVGTMHRMKGLEYKRVILAAVTDGIIPKKALAPVDPVHAARSERRDRSLLFVAATRARDTLHITSTSPPTLRQALTYPSHSELGCLVVAASRPSRRLQTAGLTPQP